MGGLTMQAAIALLSIGSVSAWDGWTDCGSSDDIATLNDVAVVPDPPVKGTPLTFSFDLTIKDTVDAGTINLDLKYGDVIPIPIKLTDDLCDDFKDFGGCPVAPGPLKFSIPDETIPKLIPEKHIYGNIKLTRADSKQIACIKLDAIVNVNHTVSV